MSQAPKLRALLARADVKLFQCLVIDSKYQKRNIIVYQCGEDIFYSSKMDGLMDVSRRKVAPSWLREQLTNPPEYTVLLTHLVGVRVSEQIKEPVEITEVRQPEGAEELELDDDGVAQG
jgi:hypothetical protein